MTTISTTKKETLEKQALKAKYSYKLGLIGRDEAKKTIAPYIELFNSKSREIAKKYNLKPKLISFSSYVR